MPITFNCKCCGAGLEFEKGATVAKCEYCGVIQTLPRLDDDRRKGLYARANYFRQNGDFDKAMVIYEQILSEDNTDSEAYWSLVLCRYGVEYVEDPVTHKRVPTVNRTQPLAVTSDKDYEMALNYADASQAEIYKAEAEAIDKIQHGILEISRREKPFDVFISYKNSDANGQRTPDSVIAVDLYEKLTQEGFKVFCSRITLEDKIGQKYEPYIFAALNSAPVMIVLGTKPEYFNAVWVRNEWSRYLSLIKNGAKKTLIPAFKDMSPYELPEEFAHLQAQDMSKIGFMQDLIRGIKKLIRPEAKKNETVTANPEKPKTAPLLKRAFMFLEEGNFYKADEYFERVLDINPENSMAYLGNLMIENDVKRYTDLANCEKPFYESNNYQKAIRFGDEKLISILKKCNADILERIEQARLTEIYNQAIQAMNTSKNEIDCKNAAKLFESIINFKDSRALSEKCLNKAEQSRKRKKRRLKIFAIFFVVCLILGYYQKTKDVKFIEICKNGSEQEVINAINKKANVNATDWEDNTALMWVASNGNVPIVNILIEAGAYVNAKNEYGDTALMWAVSNANAENVNTLIDAGADIKAKNNRNQMALDYARENEKLKGTDALKRLEELSR